MKIKTSEATGLRLDWGLSIALGHEKTMYLAHCGSVHGRDKDRGWTSVEHFNADLCMALIKEHELSIDNLIVGFDAKHPLFPPAYGDTLQQAVARMVVWKFLGGEFEVPDELAQGDQS